MSPIPTQLELIQQTWSELDVTEQAAERSNSVSPIPNQLELIQQTWSELDVTQILKKQVPLNRWYLIDRLVQRVFPPGAGGGE